MNRLTLLVVAAFVASAVPAQDSRKTFDLLLRRHDKDHRGFLTSEQVKDDELFRKLDRTKNGRIPTPSPAVKTTHDAGHSNGRTMAAKGASRTTPKTQPSGKAPGSPGDKSVVVTSAPCMAK